MKQIKSMVTLVLFPVLILAAFFSSCDREEENEIAFAEEVRFSIGGNETKSTQTGIFDEGDFIGVFAVEHTGGGISSTSKILAANLQYRFNGTEFKPASGVTPIRFNGKPMDFYVYAPYSASNSNIRSIRGIAVNQDIEGGWKASDFVTAVNTTGIKEGIVPLHFFHKFATVRLNVEEIPGILGASMNSVKTEALLDFASNKANVTGSATSLKMFPRGGGNGLLTYELTVPVQSTGTGNLFTLKKNAGNDVRCMADAAKTLTEGDITPFGINLMMDVSFGEYPSFQGTATGNGKYSFNSTCTINATPKSGYHFTGWKENGVKISDNASYSFSIVQNRIFTPTFLTDTTYGTWSVSVSASPTTIVSGGGSSVITAKAERDILVNGIKSGKETATPTLTHSNSAFTLSGNNLSIGNNTTIDTRSCVITATYDGKSSTCTVTQGGGTKSYGAWTVTVVANPVIVASTGGTSTITATAVRDILINGVKSGTDTGTPTLSRGNSVFTLSGNILTVGNNTTTNERTCIVTASIDSKSSTCTVTQPAGTISYGAWAVTVSASPTTIASGGGSSVITSSAVRDVLVNGVKTGTENGTPTLSRDNSNFSLSGNTLSVGNNAQSSARSCTVTANQGGKTATCTVTQSPGIVITYEYTFSVSNWQANSGSGGGSHTATITSYKTRYENGTSTGRNENVGYSLYSCDSWISANDGPTFSWGSNSSTSSRSGRVTWRQNESGKTDYAQISQDGVYVPTITTETSYEISISPGSYTFASTGGSKSFSVSCTKVVKTYSDGSLIDTNRTAYSGYSTSVSGSGFSCSGTTVSASKNNSTSSRSGTFTVSVGGYSGSASLSQEGALDIDTEV